MPWLIAVAGAAGAGKSTVGRELARRLHAALLDGDAVHGPLVSLTGALPWPDVREAAYAGLREGAAVAASVGTDVVVVAPFTRECREAAAWARVAERASAAGSTARLVWVSVPDDVLMTRLATRAEPRDAGKLADPDAWLGQARAQDAPVVPHLALDGSQPPGENVERVLAWLAASG